MRIRQHRSWLYNILCMWGGFGAAHPLSPGHACGRQSRSNVQAITYELTALTAMETDSNTRRQVIFPVLEVHVRCMHQRQDRRRKYACSTCACQATQIGYDRLAPRRFGLTFLACGTATVGTYSARS